METLDDLNLKGLKILQDSRFFKFGIDSVLLSDFAMIRRGRTVVDFGTGNGIIPLLLYGKYRDIKVRGLELISELYELAARNVELNGLTAHISVIHGNIKDAASIFGKSAVDYVVSNPPYLKGDGLLNESEYKRIARHELACTIDDITAQAAIILNESGTLYLVHRCERLTDVLCSMRAAKIEPKVLRFVAKNSGSVPNLFLIKGTKNAKPGIKVRNTLYIYNGDGSYTEEIGRIYGRG